MTTITGRDPAVPRSLRAALGGHPLPGWLCAAGGLAPGARVEDLHPEPPGLRNGRGRRRLERHLCRLVGSHQSLLRDLRVLDRPWPPELDLMALPWSARTRHALGKSAITADARLLSELTFGELLALPGIGPGSALEFAVRAEAAVDRASGAVAVSDDLRSLARKAASAPWAAHVSAADPRFADLLANGGGTLADRLAAVLGPGGGRRAAGWLGLAGALPEIVDRVERIEQSPLDVAVRAYVEALSGLAGERLEALLGRLGCDGRPPRSLPQAVNGAAVSTERIRQWQVRLDRRRPPHPVYMPSLDRALDLLAGRAPVPAAAAAAELVAAGVTTIPFHPASVLAAAGLCGRTTELRLVRMPKGECVVTRPIGAEVPAAVGLASRLAGSFGAASVPAVAVAARARAGIDLSAEQVQEALRHYSDAEFLDVDWLWFPGRRGDRLETLTQRILAVAAPLDVATIRRGVCRAYPRQRSEHVPPERVLEAYFERHPAFSVDVRGRVRPTTSLDPDRELGKADRVFVDVFRSSPNGVLDRASFEAACLARGMSRPTFSVSVAYSAVLDNPLRDTWCLRGTRVSAVTASAPRHAKRLDGPLLRPAPAAGSPV